MPDLAHVSPGDPLAISAGDFNAMIDAARAYQRLGEGGDTLTALPGSSALTVLVRNDTGGALAEFSPVRLGGATLLVPLATWPADAAREPAFAGLACDGVGPVAVLQEAVPGGAFGRAVVQGVTVARVPSGAAAGSYASPPGSGNGPLTAGGGFARLLSPATTSGSLTLALVQIGLGGVASVVPVTASAANSGTTWTAGSVVGTGEAVQLQPQYGAGVTAGSVTWPAQTLVSGLTYLAYDSGTTDGGSPAKRRLYAMPIGLVVCSGGSFYGL